LWKTKPPILKRSPIVKKKFLEKFGKLSYICSMEKCRATWYKNKEGKIVRFRVCINKSNIGKNYGLGYYRKMEIYINKKKR